jgi:hypothetical protein
MVLSACSTYFEQLFLEHAEPNPIVIMRETSFIDLAIIVEFMYKGEINVSQVNYKNNINKDDGIFQKLMCE